MSRVACVVIGRNEGLRLRRALQSALAQCEPVVYVDSASTDGSAEVARALGVEVVELSRDAPLSAARARNAGMRRIAELGASPHVQLLDGDSELEPGWIARASGAMAQDGAIAAVAGRLRERHREASIYNRLCEIEWAQEPGDVDHVGGIAMMRSAAFESVDGFDPDLIAGEEPDLCARLRDRRHRVVHLDAPMAIHDAAMTRFSQWWKRNVRAGHAYAEAVERRPDGPAMGAGSQVRSIVFWGIALPTAGLLLAPPTLGGSLLLPTVGLPMLAGRVYSHLRRRGHERRDASLYAAFCVAGKTPQALGLVRFHVLRRLGRRSAIIEHKVVG